MRYTSPLIKEILKSPSAQKSLDRVSPIYMDSKIGLWLFQSMGLELDELRKFTEDMQNQILPQTTVWAIDYWEQEYGIPVNKDLSLEEIRRPRLLNKIRSRAPMNPAKLVKLIKTEINNLSIPVEILENVHRNTFRIKITPGSFHTNWKQIYKLVDRVKPAHVIYTIFMYDLSKFYVPIDIDARLNIISDFYVRKGAIPWFLNGSVFLDNDIYLNGYKGNIAIDYYPLSLLIKDYVNVNVDYFYTIKYPLSFKVDINQNSKLNIISDFEVRHTPKALYIDGSWLTNGTYGLNGYTEEIYLDYYPLKLILKDYINPKISFLHNTIYHSYLKADTKIANKLDIKSDFEVRHIPNPLYIDGNWLIDGTYRLNGGKEEVYTDYYPLKLLIKNSLNAHISTGNQYNYKFSSKADLKQSSNLKIHSEILETSNYKSASFKLKNYVQSNISLYQTLRNLTNYKIKTNHKSSLKFISYLNSLILCNSIFKVSSPIMFNVRLLESIKLVNSYLTEIKLLNSIKFTSSSNISLSNKIHTKINSKYKTDVKYGENSTLTVNSNLWYLDGSFFLDGENNLEPTTITYKI